MTAVELHHVQAGPGDAETVLLTGSLGSTLEMWDPQAAALAERFRVVRVDTRGHGRSPVPPGPYVLDDLVDDVVAVLDRLGVARAHVVGLSLGGVVAMRLAVREPERVGRLALLCTSAHFPSRQAWLDRAAAVRAGGTGAVAPAVAERWFTPALAARAPEVVARWRDAVAATPAEAYAACCELLGDLDLTGELARISAPTLVVAAAQDPSTPPEQLRVIADLVPGARLHVVDDAAHLVNLEQPDAVNALLLEHLGAGGRSGPRR